MLELKEKLGTVALVPDPAPEGSGRPELVARDALVELGWTIVEAEQALAATDPELPAEERVRVALRGAA